MNANQTASENETRIMIGGQAMRTLGHDRHTDDVDYLVNLPGQPVFLHEADGDLVNAAAHNFLAAVWADCTPTAEGVADVQTLAELKAWALIQCCQNFDFRSVAKHEYDLKCLAREHGVRETPILARFAHAGELAEIASIIRAAVTR